MAPHSSTLAWKIPWTEEPGGLQSMGSLRVGHDWATSLSHIGEGNGNPLQCSCLENPRDGGAWWAAVYGVTWSWTRLKQLSSSSSKARMLKWFAIPLSCGPCFVRTLHHDSSILGGLHGLDHSFIELDKAVVCVISLISFLWLWFSFFLPSEGKDKRLMEASWWERLTEGKSGSCSDGWHHSQ